MRYAARFRYSWCQSIDWEAGDTTGMDPGSNANLWEFVYQSGVSHRLSQLELLLFLELSFGVIYNLRLVLHCSFPHRVGLLVADWHGIKFAEPAILHLLHFFTLRKLECLDSDSHTILGSDGRLCKC